MDRSKAADRLRGALRDQFTGRALKAMLADVEALEHLPELMGTAAVAAELGTTTANLPRWRELPAPLYSLPAGRFYDAEAVRQLAASRRREAEAGAA